MADQLDAMWDDLDKAWDNIRPPKDLSKDRAEADRLTAEPPLWEQAQAHAHGLAKGAAEMFGISPEDAAGVTGSVQANSTGGNLRNAALALGPAAGAGALAGPLLPLAALASEKLGGPRLPNGPGQAAVSVFRNSQPQAFQAAAQNQQEIDDTAMSKSPSSAFTETLGPAALSMGLGGMGRGPSGGGAPVGRPNMTSMPVGKAPGVPVGNSFLSLDALKQLAIDHLAPGGRIGRSVASKLLGSDAPPTGPTVDAPTPHTPSPTLGANQPMPIAVDPLAEGGNVQTSGPATSFNFPRANDAGRPAPPWSAVGSEPPEMPPAAQTQMQFPEPGGTREFTPPSGQSGLSIVPRRPVPQFPQDFPNTDPDTYTPAQMALSQKADALSAGRPRFSDPDSRLPDYGQLTTPQEDAAGSGFLGLDELQQEFPNDPLSPEAHDYVKTVERLGNQEGKSVADSPRAKLRLASNPPPIPEEDPEAAHADEVMRQMPGKSPGQDSFSHTVEAMLRDTPMQPEDEDWLRSLVEVPRKKGR